MVGFSAKGMITHVKRNFELEKLDEEARFNERCWPILQGGLGEAGQWKRPCQGRWSCVIEHIWSDY